jgi:UDP-glucose 4-epimerase
MRVLVTGGAGFIGSHVADAFIKRGDDVLVVDNLSTGDRDLVPEKAAFERVDITDANALAAAFDALAPKLVCHLAAQASVGVSVERPEFDLGVNVRGTMNVCEGARKHGAPVVFASTGGALYGNEAPLPTSEEYAPRPLSPYGASKLAAESYVATWGRLYERPNIILRLANVYGPRQTPLGESGVVAIFSEALLDGKAPPLRGEGKQTRDYLFVENAAEAFVAAAGARRAGLYNVGTGRPTSTAKLLALLQQAAGTKLEPEQRPLLAGELQTSALDPALIAEELDWRATVSLEEGLKETLRWYKKR